MTTGADILEAAESWREACGVTADCTVIERLQARRDTSIDDIADEARSTWTPREALQALAAYRHEMTEQHRQYACEVAAQQPHIARWILRRPWRLSAECKRRLEGAGP